MLEASKIIFNDTGGSDIIEKALSIFADAIFMRNEQIEKAKALPDRSTEIEYIDMIYEAHEVGRDKKDFTKAMELLKKAVQIYPDGEYGMWGLATVLMHDRQYSEAIKIMHKLIEAHPNPRYKFE